MTLFKWLLRIRQSKGYGVHSPFAFNFITQILYSPYSYYAFSDILQQVGHDSEQEIHQIFFRLVNHFKPENILEIHPRDGVGSLYISSPYPNSKYTSVVADDEVSQKRFDAIFINWIYEDNFLPSVERLIEISNKNCFWVINPINTKSSKQLWRHIVNDARVSVTFDFKNKIGIAFLKSTFHKQHYYV